MGLKSWWYKIIVHTFPSGDGVHVVRGVVTGRFRRRRAGDTTYGRRERVSHTLLHSSSNQGVFIAILLLLLFFTRNFLLTHSERGGRRMEEREGALLLLPFPGEAD